MSSHPCDGQRAGASGVNAPKGTVWRHVSRPCLWVVRQNDLTGYNHLQIATRIQRPGSASGSRQRRLVNVWEYVCFTVSCSQQVLVCTDTTFRGLRDPPHLKYCHGWWRQRLAHRAHQTGYRNHLLFRVSQVNATVLCVSGFVMPQGLGLLFAKADRLHLRVLDAVHPERFDNCLGPPLT